MKNSQKNSELSLIHDFIFSLDEVGVRLFDAVFKKFCTDCKHTAISVFRFLDSFLFSMACTTEKNFDHIFEEPIISVFFCDKRDPALI